MAGDDSPAPLLAKPSATRWAPGTGNDSTTWPPCQDTWYWLVCVPPGRAARTASIWCWSTPRPAGARCSELAHRPSSACEAGALPTAPPAQAAISAPTPRNRLGIPAPPPGEPVCSPGPPPRGPRNRPPREENGAPAGGQSGGGAAAPLSFSGKASPPQVVLDHRGHRHVEGAGRRGEPLLARQKSTGV